MFASVSIPRASLQACLAEQPDKRYQPVVVLDEADKVTTSQRDQGKLRVLETSTEADDFAVYVGMTAVQAQARCDYVLLLNRSSRAERQLTESLLKLADQFSPDFESAELGTCLIDVGAIAESASIIASRLQECCERLPYECHIGLGANPDLAQLASMACEFYSDNDTGVVLENGDDIERLIWPLPMSVLKLSPEMSELFELWGIRSVGQLAALNRGDLVERLGGVAGGIWDRANGCANRLLTLVRPATEYHSHVELEYEAITLEPLMQVMQQQLESIVSQLQNAYLVASKLVLKLELADGNIHQREFRIPEPCADVAMLAGVLEVHLDGFDAHAPITGIALTAWPSRAGQHQFDLFASGVKDPNRLSETLARIEALLGSERFGVPRMQSTHRPDRFTMEPFRPEKEIKPLPNEAPRVWMDRLPLKRYRPRRHVRIETQCIVYSEPMYSIQSDPHKQLAAPVRIVSGDFKGRLTDARGPYCQSGNWWEKVNYWKRQEWDVSHENGRLYRLAREKGEWFVEAVG